jgi:DNA-binding MarR family transcriptional regulator
MSRRTVSDSARRLAQVFGEFLPAFRRFVDGHMPADGPCSYARVRLLGVLHCGGQQMMSALSSALDVTPRNVTALVDALEADGLVERRAHPTDRRATLIALTSRGKKTCDATLEPQLEAMASLFDSLDPKEQRALLALMEKLSSAIPARPAR